MGKFLKGAVTILVLSLPNFVWGQSDVNEGVHAAKSELAPMEFSWYRDCAEPITQKQQESIENSTESTMTVVRVPRQLVCLSHVYESPRPSLHQLNRYDNGLPATAMLSSEIYFREY